MKKIISLILLTAIFSLAGCSGEKEKPADKINDVDFTVVEDIDLPEEVKALIEERKANPFQVAFVTGENTYIAVGYGEQPTGGFSITVNEVYMAEDGLHVSTTLVGPAEDASVSTSFTYPYIVLKTEVVDGEVIFEP